MEHSLYGTISEDENNNTYVFGSHQYALFYWVRAISQNKLNHNAQLIHIDFHSDFLSSEIDFKTLLSSHEIKSLIENRKIRNDTFIRPAIAMGIVEDIAFCCFQNRQQPYGDFINYVSPISILDKLNNNEPLSNRLEKLRSNIVRENLILDIDLDCFFMANKKSVMIPKNRDEIINEIHTINRLFEFASITTIATSPEIGKDKQRKFIRELFSEYFVVNIDFEKPADIIDFY